MEKSFSDLHIGICLFAPGRMVTENECFLVVIVDYGDFPVRLTGSLEPDPTHALISDELGMGLETS